MLSILLLAASAFAAEPIGFIFDNPYFTADLTARDLNGKLEDNGTLRALVHKAAGIRIERSKNRMHWAPSFQRVGAKDYRSIGIWDPVQQHAKTAIKNGVRLTRSGYEQGYPEIHLWTQYDFFNNVPYFIFRSTLTIEKPMEMFFLRNQEMTMDHIFTHVAWPGADGKPVVVDFEARKPLLAAKPLPVDVAWVAFLNLDKGFGYGAVTLKHSASKTANPLTSINDGVNPPARYWDRRLINQAATHLDKGDKFTEETAYVVFKTLDEFLQWETKLRKGRR